MVGQTKPALHVGHFGILAPGTSAIRVNPIPCCNFSGNEAMVLSTPRFTQIPLERSCTAEAIADFPERGAPFRTTIWPAAVT
jgi:hypothetical protein